jgi:hypothetical protein
MYLHQHQKTCERFKAQQSSNFGNNRAHSFSTGITFEGGKERAAFLQGLQNGGKLPKPHDAEGLADGVPPPKRQRNGPPAGIALATPGQVRALDR